ncbi:indolepyruvate ferredoxin oxidoreductase family protein [Acidiferrimicrobium sp. IK]|uniref:indolepyruvate ferredoxin oxidoreductase family protein n=1 Tax=Acidiferrimicrobium sp. IK TaxID=2871700 RepID=UPI0021CAF431|nr:indolepyruvate ferredoxin oxidoreductase family protein [Acidiferrimicrobium sp. IK]MCU4186800.1 indolepyruvate ferredoxin oxidoreductase family protein [Acidiferrimicrobium sp. IK]
MTDVIAPDKSHPTLHDRWTGESVEVHLSGVQAAVRVIVDQLRADRMAGHRTAAFVSGYQGSPLAGFDKELGHALRSIHGLEVVHRPAVNEELAVTAVMGSQLSTLQRRSRVDGVLGVWYGKAPGLDRSMDAMRHANYAGASALGGAVALVGDDPSAKSSTLPSASEAALADLAVPVLFPRTLAQVLELGHHAIALSRWSGSWTALKMVTSVADGEGSIALAPPPALVLPEGWDRPPVSGDLLTPATIEREEVVRTSRIDAAGRYGDANGLNRIVVAPRNPRVWLVAAGTVFSELLEAVRLLGLDPGSLDGVGIGLAEVRMPFPLGAGFARSLAASEEIVVIEERRELIEHQLLDLLARSGTWARVIGRRDQTGRPLIPRHGNLDAHRIARLLAPGLRARFGPAVQMPAPPRMHIPLAAETERVPWFCSGCPHSVSTVVPEGTLVGEGIGCHSIVHFMPDSRVGQSIGITQMGGEGAQWIGMAPFVTDRHVVQNLGDGTFFHSGHLAVRAAVAAGVAITFKVLWNGATAMTGGQDIAGGAASPVALGRLLLLEGVRRVTITTDDMSRYRRMRMPEGVTVRPREDVVAVQEELAGLDGVTAMIHDQACATELRRARKRGLVPSPRFRVVINERVCEGCGDCQAKSNCLSLQTVETAFGPKTRIDPESCNTDLSCLQGDCPAFTLVEDDGRGISAAPSGAELAIPPAPVAAGPLTVRIAGVGGTGVVTVAHLLAWAAMLEGVEVWGLDQTGLSQKAGPVISDLRMGRGALDRSNVLGEAEVDLLLAADLPAAARSSVLAGLDSGRTAIVASTTSNINGPALLRRDARPAPTTELSERLRDAARPGASCFFDAAAVAAAAGVPATTANVVLLGAACQLGLLPVSAGALRSAVEANDVAAEANLSGFEAGRAWAHDPHRPIGADTTAGPGGDAAITSRFDLPESHRPRIAALAQDLVEYQDPDLAERHLRLVEETWRAERAVGGEGHLAAAAASGYHKLLAYKDEYEVARLLLEHPAAAGRTTWLLHPPALRGVGLRQKIHLRPPAKPLLQALRALRSLRGRALDPFGRSPLRRTERALPVEYAASIRTQLARLRSVDLEPVTALASLPMKIRGYEDVKLRAIEEYRTEMTRLVDLLQAGQQPVA